MRFPEAPGWAAGLATAGVTGTNGKTTTTAWLAAALRAGTGAPVVRVTTVGAFVDEEPLEVAATYDGFLAAMRTGLDRGGRAAAIELTSEALAAGFATGWPVRVGVFTNLTRDHLDAHGSAEHYLASKAQLFVHLPWGGAAVLNAHDPASALLSEVVPQGVRKLTYGAPGRGPGGEIGSSAERAGPGAIGSSAYRAQAGEIGSSADRAQAGEIGSSADRAQAGEIG
ncbi:MAG: Mur ligase family protein, partial [Polyangiaceae bacterium]